MKETDILIIGAGPVGLFTVFEAGLLGLNCELVDNLDKIGGQCIELYPDKPIYDIPGVANQTGKQHIEALLEQIKPFDYNVHLNTRVESVESKGEKWIVKTNNDLEFLTSNIFIAAGAGSFESRRPPVENPDRFLGNGIEYAVRDIKKYENKDYSRYVIIDEMNNYSHLFAKSMSSFRKLISTSIPSRILIN